MKIFNFKPNFGPKNGKFGQTIMTTIIGLALAILPFSAMTSFAGPDTTPPSVPTNLAAALNAGGQVFLTWTPSTDNTGVSGYTIMRNGAVLANTVGTSYIDTATALNTAYSYAVLAYDAAGNVSAASASVTITTATSTDTTPPAAPANLTATATSSSQIDLNWTASTDNVGVAGYMILRNNAIIADTNSTTTTYSDMLLQPNTAYSYTVLAFDAAGNVSPASNTATATTSAVTDTTPPSVPTNLSASAVSSSQINLTWTASTDNVGVTGYHIYRDGSLIATSTTNSFSDTNLTASTTYSYGINAFDAAGNTSTTTSLVSATTLASSTPDTTPPSVPTNLSASAVSSSQINLTWTASSDNVGVTGYNVYRDGSLIATSTTNSFSDINLNASTTYNYTVSAFDTAGNASAQSATVSATTLAVSTSGDTTPPSAPANLTATAVSSTQVNLNWTASTDNVGVTGYIVTRTTTNAAHSSTMVRSGNRYVPVTDYLAVTTTNSFTDNTVQPNTMYAYRVMAFDAAGNVSAASNMAIVSANKNHGDDDSDDNEHEDSSNGNHLGWTIGNHFGWVVSNNKRPNNSKRQETPVMRSNLQIQGEVGSLLGQLNAGFRASQRNDR